MNEKALYESMFRKVRVIERTNGTPRERTGTVIAYESCYDSGCGEACIWIDDNIEPGILRQSDIMLLQIIE